MSEPKPYREIKLEDAEKLLVDSQFVHVFEPIPDDGDPYEYYWPKPKVIDYLTEFGAAIAGDNYRRIRHGLCAMGKDGKYRFFETKGPERK